MKLLKELVATGPSELVEVIEKHWAFWARPDQLPQEPQKPIWLVLGGRGAGKTRTGAEWVKGMALGIRPIPKPGPRASP